MAGGVRHVWVRQPHVPAPSPGLVVQWRQVDGLWQAWVLWVDLRTSRLVADWMPAERLEAVRSAPSTGSAYG